jgi:hypothetical protein
VLKDLVPPKGTNTSYQSHPTNKSSKTWESIQSLNDISEARKLADMKEISKWLVILGGIVALIEGILTILESPFFVVWGLGGVLGGLISGIITIVLALIALATSGVVDIKALKMENNWVILLVLGILIFLFGGNLGGVLVLVGAILLLLK